MSKTASVADIGVAVLNAATKRHQDEMEAAAATARAAGWRAAVVAAANFLLTHYPRETGFYVYAEHIVPEMERVLAEPPETKETPK